MCSSSGGQNLHYTASGIITTIGVMIPDDKRHLILNFAPQAFSRFQ